MWDLSSIKKSQSGGGKVRAGRRASISAMSATSHAGSENGKISCVGKVRDMLCIYLFVRNLILFEQVKVGTTLSSSLAKFTSISAIDHPRYPLGTFLIASKTNSIGMFSDTI